MIKNIIPALAAGTTVAILGLGTLIVQTNNPTMICIDQGIKKEIFAYDIVDDNKTVLTASGYRFNRDDCEVKDQK